MTHRSRTGFTSGSAFGADYISTLPMSRLGIEEVGSGQDRSSLFPRHLEKILKAEARC